MFNVTSKYFSFSKNKPTASWVAHTTRYFLTCYSCSYYSSMHESNFVLSSVISLVISFHRTSRLTFYTLQKRQSYVKITIKILAPLFLLYFCLVFVRAFVEWYEVWEFDRVLSTKTENRTQISYKTAPFLLFWS